jgi:hypothetical protein
MTNGVPMVSGPRAAEETLMPPIFGKERYI